ncbi:MAG: ATP-binding protein [Verrucomicrobiota bacterium]
MQTEPAWRSAIRQHLRKPATGETTRRAVEWCYEIPEFSQPKAKNEADQDQVYVVADKEPKRLKLQVEQHFDLEPWLLIVDQTLGSVGLVYAFDEEQPNKIPTIEKWVNRALEDGAYLHHLFNERVAHGSKKQFPLFVEVILVLPANPETLAVVDTQLRDRMQRGNHMHAVGINICRITEPTGIPEPREIERAFSWLMNAAYRWFHREVAENESEDEDRYVDIERLTLQHFRVAGERVWNPVKSPIHLLHGSNGTGKSSLVEAIEFIHCGRIRRLGAQTQRYRTILTNRTAAKKNRRAEVRIKQSDLTNELKFIPDDDQQLSENSDPALQPDLHGDSIRLDQDLSDRLSRGSGADRAEIFMTAFFPGVGSRARSRRQNKIIAADKISAWTNLVPSMIDRPETDEALIAAYGHLLPQQTSHDTTFHIASWLGLSEDTAQLFKSLDTVSSVSSTEDLKELGPTLDAFLEESRRCRNHLSTIRSVIAFLQFQLEQGTEVKEATAVSPEAYKNLLDDWLETHATTEMWQKQFDIWSISSAAIKNAGGLSEQKAENPTYGLTEYYYEDKELQEREEILRDQTFLSEEKRESVLAAFAALKQEHNEFNAIRGSRSAKAPELPRKAELDLLGTWLFPDEREALSSTLKHRGPRVKIYGRFSPRRFIKELTRAQTILETLNQHSWSHGEELIRVFLEALDAAQACAETDSRTIRDFVKLLKAGSPLEQAVNELLAVMTPARWAYEPLVFNYDDSTTTTSMNINVGKDEARVNIGLSLNTAELNAFTLSLFLLCAVGQPGNRLRKVLLDDPLQNMDELTVTTVARAIARLVRLWQGHPKLKAWELAIFLHSEDDVWRMEQDLPCATYQLPWLTPSQKIDDEEEVKEIGGRYTHGLLSLGKYVELLSD